MLIERIQTEMKNALRARDAVRLNTLRMLKSAVGYHLLEKGGIDKPPVDADVIAVVQKQAKQRRDSIASYEKGGRPDLVEKEKTELAVLESYLPKQMAEDELRAVIKATIVEMGATTKSQMGAVMKVLMPKLAGKADGKLVSQLVQQSLP